MFYGAYIFSLLDAAVEFKFHMTNLLSPLFLRSDRSYSGLSSFVADLCNKLVRKLVHIASNKNVITRHSITVCLQLL